MNLETEVLRREFLEFLGFGGLVLAAPAFAYSPLLSEETPSERRKHFVRNAPDNINSWPFIPIPETKKGYALTGQEMQLDLQDLRKTNQISYGKEPVSTSSTQEAVARLEQNLKYADGLVSEAKKSIDDMVIFLRSKYVPKHDVHFTVAKSANEVSFTNARDFNFCVVAGYGWLISSYYTFLFGNRKITIPKSRLYNAGGMEYKRFLTKETEKGFKVEMIGNVSLFYNTSTDIARGIVILAETPAVEYVHRLMTPYTLNHLNKEVRDIGHSESAYLAARMKTDGREEKLVHALSILWWKQYKNKIGVTQKEIDERLSEYEHDKRYQGSIQLSRQIANIGVQKAIEMYVTNPDALFKGIEK